MYLFSPSRRGREKEEKERESERERETSDGSTQIALGGGKSARSSFPLFFFFGVSYHYKSGNFRTKRPHSDAI